jgi:starch synthase
MRVLFISAEVAPFAKVGGLADVASGLPKALVAEGHDCRVIMPAYQMIESDPQWKVERVIEDFEVELNPNWVKKAYLSKVEYEGVVNYLIGTDEWYDKAVDSGSLYQPGGELHQFFSAAVFRAMELLGWIPDVLHANDWHTGFVPVLLKERAGKEWSKTASIFTIHNLAYQGEFGLEALDWLGLPHWLYNYEQVEAWGRVNFLKAGMVFADRVNTVSPTYAEQIQTKEYGCALEGFLQHLNSNGKLSGILNGLDMDTWNPETDKDLARGFDFKTLQGKAECKADLLSAVGMKPIDGAPLFGMVSRLSSQKGFDLVLAAAPKLFELPIQLVIQGLGDPHLVEGFRALERAYPNNFRLMNVFDAPLAQKVYGGSDAFLMPSAFEPCGLGQLIAMRYGTVPVVRATGGLKDTVHEGDNGFVFNSKSTDELIDAVGRAAATYKSSEKWTQLVKSGMTTDWSWKQSAQRYTQLYKEALGARMGLAMV